jgi:hypothetical protein
LRTPSRLAVPWRLSRSLDDPRPSVGSLGVRDALQTRAADEAALELPDVGTRIYAIDLLEPKRRDARDVRDALASNQSPTWTKRSVVCSRCPLPRYRLTAHRRFLPRNGSVQAFKFRDRDGHPLELLYFPPGQGRPIWHQQAKDLHDQWPASESARHHDAGPQRVREGRSHHSAGDLPGLRGKSGN